VAVRGSRAKIAEGVWFVAAGFATLLGVGVLCVAFGLNEDNPLVAFFLEIAGWVDFGTLKEMSGKNARTNEALMNWGIAAVLWLILGRIGERLIRP
jgi:hypothetical protein